MTPARNLVSEGVSLWSRRALHARHGSPTQGAAESHRSFRGRPDLLVLARALPLIVMAILLPAMAFSGALTVTTDTQLREKGRWIFRRLLQPKPLGQRRVPAS